MVASKVLDADKYTKFKIQVSQIDATFMKKKLPEEYDLMALGESISIPIPIEKAGERHNVYFKIFKPRSSHSRSEEPKKYSIKFVFLFGHKNYNEDAKLKSAVN